MSLALTMAIITTKKLNPSLKVPQVASAVVSILPQGEHHSHYRQIAQPNIRIPSTTDLPKPPNSLQARG